MAIKKLEYSDIPTEIDAEMARLTPHEKELAASAEENAKIPPQLYDITSKNPKALRVIHDHRGRTVAISPGQTKQNVLLQPHIAQLLNRGDLEVVNVPAPAPAA